MPLSFRDIVDAVDYANFQHYSQPLSVININKLVIPIPPVGSVSKLSDNNGRLYKLRISHGLPLAS